MIYCKIHDELMVNAYYPIDIDFALNREDEELPTKQLTFEVRQVCKSCFKENND